MLYQKALNNKKSFLYLRIWIYFYTFLPFKIRWKLLCHDDNYSLFPMFEQNSAQDINFIELYHLENTYTGAAFTN